ncbi:MAG: alpha/beta hydrolase [Roseibium sp.]|uniref:alpha/beta fold hydrolase n=1 Tax=Roseibium sp. TaxID=1936156 RepID=UPI003D9C2236
MVLIAFLFVAALFLGAFLYTLLQVRVIKRRYQPDGSFFEADSNKLHYHFYRHPGQDETAPVLVFLHGASGNAYDMKLAFLEALKGHHSLLFVDRPGLGFSVSSKSGSDLPDGQASALGRLLEALEIKTAIVVGHSLGSAVTAALGLAAPERVKGLAFLAPVSHEWPGGVNWYYNLAALPVIGALFSWTLTLPVGGLLVPSAMTNVFLPDRAPQDYFAGIRLPLLFRPASFRANSRQIALLKPALIRQSRSYSKLQQPTLVVSGTEDTVVWPSIHCEGLLRDLPNAQLLMLDQAGHMPHHTHTDDIAKALLKLVRRVEGKGEAAVPGNARGDIGSHV